MTIEDKQIRIFRSFEEENENEFLRAKMMTVQERLIEFGKIQERIWGPEWWLKPMVRTLVIDKKP